MLDMRDGCFQYAQSNHQIVGCKITGAASVKITSRCQIEDSNIPVVCYVFLF